MLKADTGVSFLSLSKDICFTTSSLANESPYSSDEKITSKGGNLFSINTTHRFVLFFIGSDSGSKSSTFNVGFIFESLLKYSLIQLNLNSPLIGSVGL